VVSTTEMKIAAAFAYRVHRARVDREAADDINLTA
jgi:hypothetical protein